ncbi:Zinc finger protein Noc [Trichinella patagoniensis]|uniref:Zinc finger protein Noc n=1 Tax=Trichinella patagoniensis TaxID=990121 RepID=A0A0V0ZRN3_9BILA|nr:Zinc finger protein Noc [Trichinella patagoniensis]
MVSTHQQYLCPDFLSPLPATTAIGSAADDSPGASCNASSSSPLLGQSQDSGKSPLALLAQTCNSIGLPDLPSTTNKSDGASQCTTTSGEGRPSPPSADPHHNHHHQQQQHNHHGRKEVHKVRSSESVDGACSSSPAKCCKSSTSKSTTPVLSRSPAAAKKEKHSTTPTQSLALPTSAMFQHLLPPAPSAVSLSLTNGGGGGGGAFALPPNSVVQFPCFGGVSSTTTLVPPPRPCTDPFCKTCPAAARACPIGCAQCAGHAPQDFASSVWMNPYLASPFFNAGLHPSVAAAAAAAAAQVGMFANLANALAGSNHHPTVAQFLTPPTNTTAGQQLLQFHQQYHQSSSSSSSSYVCNWMTGDQYCGKRFASGDELLQHLRSHATHDALKTTPSNSPASVAVSNTTAGAAASSSSSSASALLTRTLCQQQNAAASSYLSSLRFHPYTKILSSAATALPVASPLAPFAYGTPPTMPSTLAGLCPSQRLPGTLQQP